MPLISRGSVISALSIAATILAGALAACGSSSSSDSSSSDCPSPGEATTGNVGAGESGGSPGTAAEAGADASPGSLGTAGAYFAGTACHCETTTSDQETFTFTENGQSMTSSRSSDGTTCTVAIQNNTPSIQLHSNGVAERPVGNGNGMNYEPTGTWRCDRGAFRADFTTQTQAGDLVQHYLIAPPQCQLFPCAAGLRCSVNATAAQRNACIADGSIPKGVNCNEDANCQSGLRCKDTQFPPLKACN